MANNYLQFSIGIKVPAGPQRDFLKLYLSDWEERTFTELGSLGILDGFTSDTTDYEALFSEAIEYLDRSYDTLSSAYDGEEEDEEYLYLWADESGDVEKLVDGICVWQTKYEIDDPTSIEYAVTCSRPVTGEFGGGACTCYKGQAYWVNTGEWTANKEAELTAK